MGEKTSYNPPCSNMIQSRAWLTFQRCRVLMVTWRIRYPSCARVRRRRRSAFRRHFPFTPRLSPLKWILSSQSNGPLNKRFCIVAGLFSPAQTKRSTSTQASIHSCFSNCNLGDDQLIPVPLLQPDLLNILSYYYKSSCSCVTSTSVSWASFSSASIRAW